MRQLDRLRKLRCALGTRKSDFFARSAAWAAGGEKVPASIG
jgi:hypothetical protein